MTYGSLCFVGFAYGILFMAKLSDRKNTGSQKRISTNSGIRSPKQI